MSDWPVADTEILPPPFLSTFSTWSQTAMEVKSNVASAMTGASITFGTSNVARFFPMMIPWSYTVRRMWWINGSVGTTANSVDVGVYSPSGGNAATRIWSAASGFSGSASLVTATGNSAYQFATPSTPFVLDPGLYYFAITNNGTTNRLWGSTTATNEAVKFSGAYQQTLGTNGSLPATATLVQVGVAGLFMFGVTWTPSGY